MEKDKPQLLCHSVEKLTGQFYLQNESQPLIIFANDVPTTSTGFLRVQCSHLDISKFNLGMIAQNLFYVKFFSLRYKHFLMLDQCQLESKLLGTNYQHPDCISAWLRFFSEFCLLTSNPSFTFRTWGSYKRSVIITFVTSIPVLKRKMC